MTLPFPVLERATRWHQQRYRTCAAGSARPQRTAARARAILARKNAAHALAEPMLGLLVVASLVYFALGDRIEGLFLVASVVVIMAIALYQEHKTERVLQALRDLAAPRALVIRDGVERRIPGREIVVDDVLLIREGDRIAADGVPRIRDRSRLLDRLRGRAFRA